MRKVITKSTAEPPKPEKKTRNRKKKTDAQRKEAKRKSNQKYYDENPTYFKNKNAESNAIHNPDNAAKNTQTNDEKYKDRKWVEGHKPSTIKNRKQQRDSNKKQKGTKKR